jgi:type IV pilus assembly protein PilW
VPSLYCLGNGNAVPQPLVENIEDLQITYGVEKVEGGKEVGGYMTATEVNALATGVVTLQRAWNMVMTVRVCVVARSETSVAADAGSAQYYPCTGNALVAPPAGDLRLRRAFTTTVVLRNRIAVS